MDTKFAVLTSGYPSNEKTNFMAFVHSRVRAYKKLGIKVDVFLIGSKMSYDFEGVNVYSDSIPNLKKILNSNIYDALLVHFLDSNKIQVIGDMPCLIWVHGFEALSWKRRLFNINPRLPIYIYENTKQLRVFKEYSMSHPKSKFIFVSDWMYNITCEDIGFKIQNYEIIHNYIDSSIFTYNNKQPEHRKKILLIRSFANKKYANDISVDFINKLSKKEYFNDLAISIYGQGKFFNKLIKKLVRTKNIKIHNKFLTQPQIAELQEKYGVFLSPTRQDSQGVSMCEAMSSGLVPLTSNNTAIPEFVENKKDGLLCDNDNIESFINSYESMLYNPEYFLNLSKNASDRIQKQCSLENTIIREIKLANIIKNGF